MFTARLSVGEPDSRNQSVLTGIRKIYTMRIGVAKLPILLISSGIFIPGLHVYPLSVLVIFPAFLYLTLFLISTGSRKSFNNRNYISVSISFALTFLFLFALILLRGFYYPDWVAQFDSIQYIIRILLFLGLYFAMKSFFIKDNYFDIGRWINFVRFIVIAVVLFSIIDIFSRTQFFPDIINFYKARGDFGGIHTVHYNRLSGLFSYPGDLGLVLVFAIFSLKLIYKNIWSRWVLLTVLVYFLFLTQSRAAFLTFFFGLILYIPFASKRVVAFISAIAITLAIVFQNEIKDMIDDIYLLRNSDSLEFFLSKSYRYMEFSNYFSARPAEWILGLAPDSQMPFHEVETIGAASRLGVVAFFIYFLFVAWGIGCYSSAFRNRATQSALSAAGISCYWLSFLLIYCNISAGFSRPKLMVVAALGLIFVLHALPRSGNHNRQKRLHESLE
ncbi:hypothetical protein [Salibaculum griseiflavum]|uniref:hypothetical protein n=1 Tax=Salibaculum griseiflavum TaxID=1914409 RepID=UPI0011B20A37|nr:hypothetical protein [Salibaculum griseiflavum]